MPSTTRSPAIRTTREYWLPDSQIKELLGLAKDALIVGMERKTAKLTPGGQMDLFGCIVTVYEKGAG